jgi:hypothetical protein
VSACDEDQQSPPYYNLLLLPDRTRAWRGDVDSH